MPVVQAVQRALPASVMRDGKKSCQNLQNFGVELSAPGLFGLSVDDALEVPMALVGTVDDMCETLEQRREQFGFNYWVVHEAEMEEFGQVVARLAGK